MIFVGEIIYKHIKLLRVLPPENVYVKMYTYCTSNPLIKCMTEHSAVYRKHCGIEGVHNAVRTNVRTISPCSLVSFFYSAAVGLYDDLHNWLDMT